MERTLKRLNVGVGADHIDTLIRARKPLLAIIELIWNSLDADAKRVSVILTPNGLSGLDTIQIEDDGDGITPEEFDEGFGQLGDSWKKRSQRTKKFARALHGKKGVGRYRAFSWWGGGMGHSLCLRIDGLGVRDNVRYER